MSQSPLKKRLYERHPPPCSKVRGPSLGHSMAEIEQSISNHFEEQVAKFPDRLAVKAKDGFHYDSLNRADRVARAILAKCDESNDTVGLLLPQGAAVIVAMVGVLKAGKIDVALDPMHPVARIGDMLEDSRAYP